MSFALGILTFFVVLAGLILVHELGHFSAAKLAGVRVEEFGLGFPPRLKSWKRDGTVYSLNAIPLGGFVKMLGENGAAPEPDSFGAKPPWQRLLILLAGPSMNLLLAVGIFFFVFLGGYPRGLTTVTKVEAGSPAAGAGIQFHDIIVRFNGQPVGYADQLQAATRRHLGQTVRLEIRRQGRILSLTVVPRRHHRLDQGAIGIGLDTSTTEHYTPLHAAKLAFGQIGIMVGSIPVLIESVSKDGGAQVSGPIGIAHATTQVVQQEPKQGLTPLLEFVALLSANLGVLNLLPIPALDGGRIMFVLVSWARRRNLDPEVEGLIHLAGMAVLLLLITLVSYHDIAQWIGGSL